MELKHIKELMSAMGRTGIKKVMIKKENFELQLEREGDEKVHIIEPSVGFIDDQQAREEKLFKRADLGLVKAGFTTMAPAGAHRPAAGGPSNEEVAAEEHAAKEEKVSGHTVKSPMVGTYYSSPSPDDPPFVKVGDKIDEDTVVCIIEAMKVMNEIKAGVAGTVTEMYVENGHPVEFGSHLFKII